MNRRYTSADFASGVQKLRRSLKNPAITTDIMVGFPGESDLDFEESLSFVKTMEFAKGHVFSYSKRLGTKAAQMENQVLETDKKRRNKKMITLCAEKEQLFLKKHIGEKCDVLFETQLPDGSFEGTTTNYITVRVKSKENLKNKRKEVLISEVRAEVAYGEEAGR